MSAPDIRTLRRHLRAIEREVEYQLKDQTSCCGVTPAQCHVLLELADSDGTSLVELSERLKLDASTLSRTVDSLVRAGLVDRAPDPESRRSVRLSLTAEGMKKVEVIDFGCNQFYRELLARVPGKMQTAMVEALGLLAEVFSGKRTAGGCVIPATEKEPQKGGKHGKESRRRNKLMLRKPARSDRRSAGEAAP